MACSRYQQSKQRIRKRRLNFYNSKNGTSYSYECHRDTNHSEQLQRTRERWKAHWFQIRTFVTIAGFDLEIEREVRIVLPRRLWTHQHTVKSASRDIVIEVPPEDFFKVISDYNHYRDILPQIKASRIIHRDETRTVAEFTIEVIKRVSYTLAMVEHPPYRMEWELVEGPFTENSGFWQLEALENGRTHAHYSVSVGVGIFVPKSISNRVVGKTMPAILNHFKHWAEHVSHQ